MAQNLFETRIKGVTFNNPPEEGGQSRQALLQKLYACGPTLASLENVIYDNPETGHSEFAIKVRSNVTGDLLGFIPADKIHVVDDLKLYTMILVVDVYNGTYYGTLHQCSAPTPKQYGLMKSLRAKGAITKMPRYDRTCYGWLLNQIQAVRPDLLPSTR